MRQLSGLNNRRLGWKGNNHYRLVYSVWPSTVPSAFFYIIININLATLLPVYQWKTWGLRESNVCKTDWLVISENWKWAKVTPRSPHSWSLAFTPPHLPGKQWPRCAAGRVPVTEQLVLSSQETSGVATGVCALLRQSPPAPSFPREGCSFLPRASMALWGCVCPEGHIFLLLTKVLPAQVCT